MTSVLKDLYDGKLCPAERTFARGAHVEAYKKLFFKQTEIGEQLEKQFDTQAQKMFGTYRELQINLNIMEEEELFFYAFRLGARMLLEILSPCDGAGQEDF